MKSYDKISHKILFLHHSKDVYRYAFSLLKNKEDAEDAVQEVFINYIEKSNRYRRECSVKSWLLILTRNYCYNFIKARNIRQSDSIETVNISFDTKSIEDKISIENALDHLNNEENELIFLREYMGYSYKEISTVLNISIDNVKVRLFRVKKKLKKALYNE